MFLQSSRQIYPNLFLLSLGATCRYACVSEDGSITLSDPGATLHIAHLEERMSRLGLAISDTVNVLITHLDADRVAGIPMMRRLCPRLKVLGTAAMQHLLDSEEFVRTLWREDTSYSHRFFKHADPLPVTWEEFKEALRIDRPLLESDSMDLAEDFSIRSIATPGHRAHSVAYLLVPHEFIIGDETFGYYRGSHLAAPGADHSLPAAVTSIARFDHIEISGIGFSYGGAITGQLARKHLINLTQNCLDVETEYHRAIQAGISADEIRNQIHDAFYSSELHDPFFEDSLNGSWRAIFSQLERR